jgi:hypothetical protein
VLVARTRVERVSKRELSVLTHDETARLLSLPEKFIDVDIHALTEEQIRLAKEHLIAAFETGGAVADTVSTDYRKL